MNKLLDNFEYIPFGMFSLSNLDEALNVTMKKATDTLKNSINQTISTWESVIEPLHESLYRFNRIWGIINHLLSVSDTREIRDLHNKYQQTITEFYVNLGQNKQLYQHYNKIKHEQYTTLNQEQKRVLDNEFRDFLLNGIKLNPDQQTLFKNIQTNLEKLSTSFTQNIMDATDEVVKYLTKEELIGVPEDILEMYFDAAQADNKDNLYKITLHTSSYLPIMQYCKNRSLREELYKEYVTRASELGNVAYDNTGIIKQILDLRTKKANILGFKTFSDLSLYTKMADNSTQVLEFLYGLAEKSKQYALADLDELRQFALQQVPQQQIVKQYDASSSSQAIKNITDPTILEAWDIPFFSEALQQQKYSYSNNELKQYFQLPQVLQGLFTLINQLYKIGFKLNSSIPTWHESTQTFDVMQNNKIIGNLYLDLFSRNGKQQGAWMNTAQDKYITKNTSFLPMAYIVCNFAAPIGNSGSLLTFDDVQTLFHEMGHALHLLLTKVSHYTISGINGVEWDAVELPSQFMEYFTWNYDILTSISKHIVTGATLPLELYNKLLASRYYQAGLHMLRQLEFAVFDMLIHCEENPNNLNYMSILDNVRNSIAVIFPPKYNRFPNSFSHIFGGGYAAGYYSYKWAEVLATDIFNVFDSLPAEKYFEVGSKFYENILTKGAMLPMMDNFKTFMGREPKLDALLKYTFGK